MSQVMRVVAGKAYDSSEKPVIPKGYNQQTLEHMW